jgi:hypothetical protein
LHSSHKRIAFVNNLSYSIVREETYGRIIVIPDELTFKHGRVIRVAISVPNTAL